MFGRRIWLHVFFESVALACICTERGLTVNLLAGRLSIFTACRGHAFHSNVWIIIKIRDQLTWSLISTKGDPLHIPAAGSSNVYKTRAKTIEVGNNHWRCVSMNCLLPSECAGFSNSITSRKHVFLQRCGVWMLCCAGYPALSSPVRSFKLVRRVDSLPPSCLLLRMSLKMIWATRTRFHSSLSLVPESKVFSRKNIHYPLYNSQSQVLSLLVFSLLVFSVCLCFLSSECLFFIWFYVRVFSQGVFSLVCVLHCVFSPYYSVFSVCVCVCFASVCHLLTILLTLSFKHRMRSGSPTSSSKILLMILLGGCMIPQISRRGYRIQLHKTTFFMCVFHCFLW